MTAAIPAAIEAAPPQQPAKPAGSKPESSEAENFSGMLSECREDLAATEEEEVAEEDEEGTMTGASPVPVQAHTAAVLLLRLFGGGGGRQGGEEQAAGGFGGRAVQHAAQDKAIDAQLESALLPEQPLAFGLEVKESNASPAEGEASKTTEGGAQALQNKIDAQALSAESGTVAASSAPSPSIKPAGGSSPQAPQIANIHEPAPSAAIDRVIAVQEAPRRAEAPRLEIRIEAAPPEFGAKSSAAVDVVVEQRRGDLHFSVHSADSQLNASLREALPQLRSSLEQQGFRTEAWHPVEAAAASREIGVASSQADSRQSFEDEAGNRGRQDAHEQHSGQRNQGRNDTDEWFRELESSLFSPDASERKSA